MGLNFGRLEGLRFPRNAHPGPGEATASPAALLISYWALTQQVACGALSALCGHEGLVALRADHRVLLQLTGGIAPHIRIFPREGPCPGLELFSGVPGPDQDQCYPTLSVTISRTSPPNRAWRPRPRRTRLSRRKGRGAQSRPRAARATSRHKPSQSVHSAREPVICAAGGGRQLAHMPMSGRWLSAWSCRDAHDYSPQCDTAVDRGGPSFSIVRGGQSARNADSVQIGCRYQLLYTTDRLSILAHRHARARVKYRPCGALS